MTPLFNNTGHVIKWTLSYAFFTSINTKWVSIFLAILFSRSYFNVNILSIQDHPAQKTHSEYPQIAIVSSVFVFSFTPDYIQLMDDAQLSLKKSDHQFHQL